MRNCELRSNGSTQGVRPRAERKVAGPAGTSAVAPGVAGPDGKNGHPAAPTCDLRAAPASGEKRLLPAETFAKLPVHETIVIEPPEVLAAPDGFEQIGEERTFEVDIVRRNSLSASSCARSTAARPSGRKPRDRAGTGAGGGGRLRFGGAARFIIISKYQDHLPLYRLERMSSRWGATSAGRPWSSGCALPLTGPSHLQVHGRRTAGRRLCAMRRNAGQYIDPDEKHGGTFQGYLW